MTRLSSLVRRFWVDALILAAMAGMLSISVRAPDPKGAEGPAWLDVLITIAFLGPLFFRRRFPMAAPLASAAVIVVSSFLDGGFVNNGLPIFLVALGISAWFGLRPDRRQAIAGWAALQVTAVDRRAQRRARARGRLRLDVPHLLDRLDHRLCTR